MAAEWWLETDLNKMKTKRIGMSELPVPEKANVGMSVEEMKMFVRDHFEDFVNKKQSNVAFRSFSHDFLDHDEAGGPVIGPQAAKDMMEAAYRKWPDLRVDIEDMIGEGDKVMVRNRWYATDSAIGTKLQFRGFVLWRFADGKIVERWATLTPPEKLD